jgi:hypothetical protein
VIESALDVSVIELQGSLLDKKKNKRTNEKMR